MRHASSPSRLLPAALALALSTVAGAASAESVSLPDEQPVEPSVVSGTPGTVSWGGEYSEDDSQPVEPLVVSGTPGTVSWTGEYTEDDSQPVVPPTINAVRPGPTISPIGRPISPAPEPMTGSVELVTPEDQPVALDFGPGFAGLNVVVPPAHGTLLTDRTPIEYLPNPDFHGEDTVVFGVSKPEVVLSIKVLPVNDPPRFAAGAGRAHKAGDAGVHEVQGWAQSVTAGPADESWSQRVWFRAEPVEDDEGVVQSMEVAPDGTLRYVLSGRSGAARWTVQAFDNGGNLDGGISVSKPIDVEIGVDVKADLAIKLVAIDDQPSGDGLRTYRLVVSNLSKDGAPGARVVDVLPPGSGSPRWQCHGFDGGACPKVAAGDGAIDTTVDLPGGSMTVFTVSGMALPAGQAPHAAFVVPPDHVADPDLSNNEASE